jgi:hypothetical protein
MESGTIRRFFCFERYLANTVMRGAGKIRQIS